MNYYLGSFQADLSQKLWDVKFEDSVANSVDHTEQLNTV